MRRTLALAVAVLLAFGCGGVSQADIDAAVAEALAEQAAVTTTTTAAPTTTAPPTPTTAAPRTTVPVMTAAEVEGGLGSFLFFEDRDCGTLFAAAAELPSLEPLSLALQTRDEAAVKSEYARIKSAKAKQAEASREYIAQCEEVISSLAPPEVVEAHRDWKAMDAEAHDAWNAIRTECRTALTQLMGMSERDC